MDSSVLYSPSIQSYSDGQQSLKLRQKIAELELALANQTSSSNKQVIELEERIAKLRASFEKNELVRRKLEYELTVARKELNNEVRNRKQEGEIKKKEVDECKGELSVKSKALKSMEKLLHEQQDLFEKEKESFINEIKLNKDENGILRNENHDWRNNVEELNKKCSELKAHLSSKVVEIEYTESMLNDQNMLFEKEKDDLMNKINEHKTINADSMVKNEKNTLTWKKDFDELYNKYKKLDDEHSKNLFELKSMEGLLNNQNMLFDKERETLLKEISDQQVLSGNLKHQYDDNINKWRNKYEELSEKCSLLESQRIEQTATIHKLVKDNKSICNNEQEWMEKNKELQVRIKSLVENIEAERATHLETKFNTELMELKLGDLEKELSSGRDSLKVCANNIEESQNKYRHLESVISNDKLMYNKLMENLNKRNDEIESKYEIQSKELTEKSVALSNINLELDKAKEELTEAKSHLNFYESNNNEIIKEFRFLLNNYADKCDLTNLPEEWTLNTIVEVMKVILKDSEVQMKDTEKNLEVAKSSLEKLTVDIEKQVEDAHSRGKALEQAERLVKNAQYQCSVSEVKCSDYEKRIKILEKEICCLNSEVDKKEEEIKVLIEDVSKAKLDADKNIESSFLSLQIIYDLLITGAVQPAYPNAHSINELKDIIIDKLKQNINIERSKQEEVSYLKNEIKNMTGEVYNHKHLTKKLRKINAELLSQSGKHLEEKQTLEMQLHKKLDEYKNAFDKMKTDRDGVMAKYTAIEKSLKESEQLNEKITKALQQCEHEHRYVITAIVVITGGLWALILRHQSLCVEKSILVNIVRQLFKLKGDVIELTDTVHFEITNKDADTFKYNRSVRGIFRFRIAVIAVLGAIRFYKIALHTKTINSTQESCTYHNNLLFYGAPRKNSHGKNAKTKDDELSIWLHNNDVLKNACLDAVTPLIALKKCKQTHRGDESLSHGALVETICTCYTRYIDLVKVEMESSSLFSLKSGSKKNTLIYHLGLGLKRLLEKESSQIFYQPVAEVISILHRSIMALTNKHHSSEKDRMSAVTNCERYKEERNQLKSQISTRISRFEETERTLKARVWDLEGQIENAISESQFTGVCVDLDNALKREHHLQTLLNEQKNDIFEITAKIEKQEELYQQDFHCLQSKMGKLKDKLLKLEGEKEELNVLLQKEHGEMEQFFLERELLVQYTRKVTSVLQKKSNSIDLSHLSKLNKLQETILPENVLGLDGKTITPEMQICQNTVISLVDSHKGTLYHIMNLLKEKQYLHGKIVSLEDEAKMHKLNVQKLKIQISALCQEDLDINNHSMARVSVKETSTPIFVPLKGHNDHF